MSKHSADSVSKVVPNNLTRQIAQYSLTAAAAGVGVLAMVQPASGEVVITKRTISVPLATDGAREPVKISMENNGVDNFSFNLSTFNGDVRLFLVDEVSPTDEVMTGGGFDAYAQALGRGAQIGPPSSSFLPQNVVEFSATYPSASIPNKRVFRGNWGGNPKNHYLGVRFQLNGQTHYGWIRLTVTTNPAAHTTFMSPKITGWAYETVPNKPILAGTAATAGSAVQKPTAEVQPQKNIEKRNGPSLGMFAAGADALPMWRREGL